MFIGEPPAGRLIFEMQLDDTKELLELRNQFLKADTDYKQRQVELAEVAGKDERLIALIEIQKAAAAKFQAKQEQLQQVRKPAIELVN